MAGIEVTGLTAERMIAMEQATVIGGKIVGDNLVLVTRGNQEVLAGNVRGIQGIKGEAGGVPPATSSSQGGVKLAGNLTGTADIPRITGALPDTVDASLAYASTPNNDGWGGGSASGVTMTLRQMVHQINANMYALQRVILKSNRTTTLWSGSMAEYNQLSVAERTATGFIAVIIP